MMGVAWQAVAVVHLTLVATWLGGMAYSLNVVQPKVARFFTDDQDREDFLITLAHGNRWKVVPLVAALVATSATMIAAAPSTVAAGSAIALGLYLAAAAIFGNVSWRHWPARVFALPTERPRYRRSLRFQAWTMLALVGTAFLITLSASLFAP